MAIGLSKEQYLQLIETIQAVMMPALAEENRRDIAAQLTAYRQAVSVRDRWCCRDMQEFAVEVWNESAPCVDPQAFGGASYRLRGRFVNFCPFCGVHLSVSADKVRRSA